MKKVLVLLLSVMLVISSVTCALVFPASAEGENLWTNPTEGFTANEAGTIIRAVTQDEYVSEPCYAIDRTWWTSFSLKLPSNLSTDKLYRLSFDYFCVPNNASDLSNYYITSMYLSKDGAAYGDKYISSKQYLETTIWTSVEQEFLGADGELSWNIAGTGTVWRVYLRNIKLVEVPTYDIAVTNGTADASKAKAGSIVTLSFDNSNNTKVFQKWEVVSGDVTLADATSATTTFTMPKNAVSVKAIYKDNLWTNPTEGFKANEARTIITAVTQDDLVSEPCYAIDKTYYTSFSLKLPSNLSTDKSYRLSFDYFCVPNSASDLSAYYIDSMYLSKDGAAYGDKYISSRQYLETTGSNQFWTSVEQEFLGADGELRWNIAGTGTVYRVYLRNIKLVEVPAYDITVTGGTANATKAKAGTTVTLSFDTANNTRLFKEWQVVSGNVELADATAETTTFTMPEGSVQIKAVYDVNVWSSITASDIVNCAGKTFPGLRSFDTSTRTAIIWGVHYQNFYIKMPQLKANTRYRLSMGYSYSAADGKLDGMRVLNQTQLDAMLADAYKNFPSDYTAIMFGSGTSSEVTSKEFVTDDTTYYLAVRSVVDGTDTDADLILSNLSLIVAAAEQNPNAAAGLKTAYNSRAALRVANNSTTDKNGMRIYNEVKTEWFGTAKIVEFGSIAIREGLMQTDFPGETAPDLSMYGKKGVGVGVAYSAREGFATLWETTDSALCFTSYLTNIKDDFYGDDYLIRAYAIDEDGYVYYGDTAYVSVYEAANAMDHGRSADGEAKQDEAAFASFVTDLPKYKDWCEEVGAKVGELFAKLNEVNA